MVRRPGHRNALCASILFVFLAGSPSIADEAAPRMVIVEEGGLALTDLPEILGHDEVNPLLKKGLTTTFLFRVDLLGRPTSKDAGGARIEIRYELWDEVYLVRLLEIDGDVHILKIANDQELESWWRLVHFDVISKEKFAESDNSRARVRLDVVPFSQAEQTDTQEWFAQSVSSAELARSEGVSTPISGSEKSGSGVFSVLIATSIRSRPLTSFTWVLDTPSTESP